MGTIIWALTVITFWIFAVAGWVMNIMAIASADFSNLTGLLILRIAGIFVAPLGSVLGLFV